MSKDLSQAQDGSVGGNAMPASKTMDSPSCRLFMGKKVSPSVWAWAGLSWLLLIALLLGLVLGRYAISPADAVSILFSRVFSGLPHDDPVAQQIVEAVRLPRVMLAAILGAGLSAAGAALQSLFRNPLAEPQLLGVSSGAAFGGVLGMLLWGDGVPVVSGALCFGMVALLSVFWLAGQQTGRSGGTVLLVLAGVVVSGVFAACVSIVKLAADPQNQLPAIVFWLMGSLAGANAARLWLVLPCVGIGLVILYGLRFQLMALSLGAEDAKALGINVRQTRCLTLFAVGLITAACVAVSGIVAWVGLVVPHLVRMGLGSDHKTFLPHVMLAGASYLILVDTFSRTAMSVEIPLGVLTALLGAPLFAFLVRRIGQQTEV
ncbi:MAG: iron ABC transporter permease [Burkholderiales bacterium]|nr:iron ABC transporter permease [Burkholderiales bacterium]